MTSNAFTFNRTPLDSLVEQLTEDERLQIMMEGDEFERTGSTGDTLLRRKAQEFTPIVTAGMHKFDATFVFLIVCSCHKIQSVQAIEAGMRLSPQDVAAP